MNMSWKKTETPLNLIQILPSESDKPQAQVSPENPSNLRIQVGDNPPTVGSKFLREMVSGIRHGGQHVGEYLKAAIAKCQRMSASMIHGVLAIFSSFVGVCKKSTSWIVRRANAWSTSLRIFFRRCWHGVIRKKNVRMDSQVHNIPPALESHVIETSRQLEQDELLWEVHALRDQMSSQKDELIRVTKQIAELKALTLSQQQVLLHLGKDLESIDSKQEKTIKAMPKKSKARSTKTSKSKPLPAARPSSTETTMSLNPRR